MRNLKKTIALGAVGTAGLFVLASCGSNSFYKEWHAAGSAIEKDNCYKVLTLDEVKEMREADESFMLFIGSSGNSNARTLVVSIQNEADDLNYEGALYFVNVKEALENLSEGKEAVATLGVKEINAGDDGLVAVCYHEGEVYFDTSNPNEYTDRFCITTSYSIDFIALADYTFEKYPVEK